MFRIFRRPLRVTHEQGTATAEYAVVTLGACTAGTILIKILQSDWFSDILKSVIKWIPDLLPW